MLLIRLMGRTGVVIEHLDQPNIEFTLSKIIDLLSSGDFIDLLLTWVIAAVDRKIRLSINIQSNLARCLSELLSEELQSRHPIDAVQLAEVTRVYSLLKENLSPLEETYV